MAPLPSPATISPAEEALPEEPLEEPVEEHPGWITPFAWVGAVEWDGGVELGINGAGGNSESLSLVAGANLARKTDLHEIKSDFKYLQTNSRGDETQHNAVLNAGYERFLGETRWAYFLKSNLFYDEFKAYDLRVVMNGGLAYLFIRTEAMKLKGRVGGGTSHEINGPDDAWAPEAVFGAEYEWEISDRQDLAVTFDYFPEWTDFRDYRFVTDLSWEVLLDAEANLSLKLSVNDRYDSTPNGARPNDLYYALMLLWKI
jgi:putative salt-induced outer membrane protein YdiY